MQDPGDKKAHNRRFEAGLITAEPIFSDLQRLYRQMPETRCLCDRPGICCICQPEMTVVEALQWVAAIREMPAAGQVECLRGFVRFYLTHPVGGGCPFSSDRTGCGVYDIRPFACRAYGLWQPGTGEERTRQNRERSRAVAAMWRKMGVALPDAWNSGEPDYCRKVRIRNGPPVSDDRLLALLREIYALGAPLQSLQTDFETSYHSDFSFLVTALLLGTKKALLAKMTVLQELTRQGTDARLLKMLARITAEKIAGSVFAA